MSIKSTLIIIPAYNEAESLVSLLPKIKKEDWDILVIDDGSSDETEKICQKENIRVIRHIINLGLGSAIKTGLEIAKREKYEKLATFDADGQHEIKDLKKILIELEKKGSDMAIGVRTLEYENMPKIKKIGNIILNTITKILLNVESRDSQSGLRAFNRNAIEKIRLKSTRYEVSSEILYQAKKNNLNTIEIPIKVVYTTHSQKKATTIKDGLTILWKLLLHKGGLR